MLGQDIQDGHQAPQFLLGISSRARRAAACPRPGRAGASASGVRASWCWSSPGKLTPSARPTKPRSVSGACGHQPQPVPPMDHLLESRFSKAIPDRVCGQSCGRSPLSATRDHIFPAVLRRLTSDRAGTTGSAVWVLTTGIVGNYSAPGALACQLTEWGLMRHRSTVEFPLMFLCQLTSGRSKLARR
jgi:hypothetical protein